MLLLLSTPRLVSVLEAASSSGTVRKQDVADFKRLGAAARLASQASRCKAAGMAELAAKQRTALLRYAGIVPADKVSRAHWRCADMLCCAVLCCAVLCCASIPYAVSCCKLVTRSGIHQIA
jgi:hypothetical protein